MGYVTKFDGRTDSTIKLGGEGNPSSIEGYFLGSKDTMSDYGPGKLHLFQTSDGVIGVWGKTRMNSLLTESHKGQMVLLTFTGMVAPSKKGRKPSYGYKLQYDPSNTIDVSNIDVNAAPAATDEDEDPSSSLFNSEESDLEDAQAALDEITPARPVAPRAQAHAASATQQAKVQALLSKNRSVR